MALTWIAAAVTVALAACGEQKPAPKAEAPKAPPAPPALEIKIGHVAPLTGGIAHLGKDNENGARLAIEQANAAKIKIEGKDAKFIFLGEDDQADPKVGTTVAQKLVDAKVAGVVGHLNSGTSIPASDIYNKAAIPVISGSATNPKLTEQGFKAQFRVVGRDDQ
ncbi:MAG: branched-chain amino acid ABC transporter substrate-binding protein, partial [Betaproteobacteria bacterium]